MKAFATVGFPMIAVLASAAAPEPVVYTGAADASAAAALSDGVLVVANDEDSTLRFYSMAGGKASRSVQMDMVLGLGMAGSPETDIEGVARVGDKCYWITSHGRTAKGKVAPNRARLFATNVSEAQGTSVLKMEGTPHATLLQDLLRAKGYEGLGLAESIGPGVEKSEALAPKDRGLNIEGLSRTADGEGLLIGFRNPRPGGKALIAPLKNPSVMVAGPATAEFGAPILLDLGGLGIRSIEWDPGRATYWIVAGPHDEKREFALYGWKGPGEIPTRTKALDEMPPEFAPEALVIGTDGTLRLFSDDGARRISAEEAECLEGWMGGTCENKSLKDPERRTFRMITVAAP